MVRADFCPSFGRALITETKVESGTSESKSGTSVNLSDSGERERHRAGLVPEKALIQFRWLFELDTRGLDIALQLDAAEIAEFSNHFR